MLSLRSQITQSVLRYFLLEESREVYVNELARRLQLDNGNLSRKLRELEKEGILKSRWRGEQRYYSLNASFPFLKEFRKILQRTIGFEPLLKASLNQVKGIKKAFLFGSYVHKRMDSLSDIDLCVIGNHSVIELQKQIAELQKVIDREINVVSLTPEEYKTKRTQDSFVRSVDHSKQIPIV